MKKSLVMAIIAASTTLATAELIDFEDIGAPSTVTDMQGISPYHGLNFNSTLDQLPIDVGPWAGTGPAHSGAYAVLNNNGGPGVMTSSGADFDFNSIWSKGWFGGGTGASTVIGSGGAGGGGTANFTQTAAWTEVVGPFLDIQTLTVTTPGIFLIDDLTINDSGGGGGGGGEVPASSTVTLVILAGLLMAISAIFLRVK